MLPIIPYEKANLLEIRNPHILSAVSAKLTINPYYKISYSLLENVRLPWYQQTVVEDKGTIVIDACNAELLNNQKFSENTNKKIIRDLCGISPVKETVLDYSEKFVLENHEWDVKVDGYKAEALAINYIKETNRRNIPYNDRTQGVKYQPYVPYDRAITILSKELILLPIWSFQYTFNDKNYEKILLASSGQVLKNSFFTNGAICEVCGKSASNQEAIKCSTCNKWLCAFELVLCSSCQQTFHKEHIHKTCLVCNQVLCNDCEVACPLCKRQQGKNHLIQCNDCGVNHCSSCTITSGLLLKKTRCLNCEKIFQEKKKLTKEKSLWKRLVE